MSDEASRQDVFILTSGSKPPAGSFVLVIVCLGVLGLLAWGATGINGLATGWRALTILGLTVVGLAVFWILGAHIEVIIGWLRWWRRPRPAMRLGPYGLDYSAAYRGTFELHVDWVHAQETRTRPGAGRSGAFWCLYAPIIEGTGDVAAFMPPEMVPGPSRAYSTARAELKQALADGNTDIDFPPPAPPARVRYADRDESRPGRGRSARRRGHSAATLDFRAVLLDTVSRVGAEDDMRVDPTFA